MKNKFVYKVGVQCDCCGSIFAELFDYFTNAKKRERSLIEHFGRRRVFLSRINRKEFV